MYRGTLIVAYFSKAEGIVIAFNPLPSGHASPFQVEIPDNSHAVAYRIRFKELLGAPLN